MDRHAKESHIDVSFAAEDSKDAEEDDQEKEVGKGHQRMMKIERKTSDALVMSMQAGNNITTYAPVTLLDIMRESSRVVRANWCGGGSSTGSSSAMLMWVMLLLICPFSTLLLSASLPLRHIKLYAILVPIQYPLSSADLHLTFATAPALGQVLHSSSFFKYLYLPLSKIIMSYSLCSPLFFTIWLLAKAFIVFTVSSTYSARKPSLQMFISIAFKLWKRLLYTYSFIVCAFFAFFSLVTLILAVLTISNSVLELPAVLTFFAELVMGLSCSLLFANMVIVANLATVVCILEDNIGMSSLVRSVHLIKGRTQLALSLLLSTTLCTAMVESLYEHRVIGVPEGNYEINTASRLWEAPLLIFMYSFLYLYDAIMSCIFYFTCKSAAPDQHMFTNDDDKKHISAAA